MLRLNKLRTRWGPVSLIILAVGISAFGVVVLTIPDPSGVIHACYSTSNGATRLVDSAADCKNNEAAISWNQVGPPGPPGPPGPAGVARATGSVFPGDPPNFVPNFYPNGLTGWGSVNRIGVGQYCLIPGPTFTNSNVLVLSLGSVGSTSTGIVGWTGLCSVGTQNGYTVETWGLDGQLSNAITFTAVVP